MDKNKNHGTQFMESFRAELAGKKPLYGNINTQLNAALAMWLCATDEDRERWLGMFQRAYRQRGARTVLDVVRELNRPSYSPANGWKFVRGA